MLHPNTGPCFCFFSQKGNKTQIPETFKLEKKVRHQKLLRTDAYYTNKVEIFTQKRNKKKSTVEVWNPRCLWLCSFMPLEPVCEPVWTPRHSPLVWLFFKNTPKKTRNIHRYSSKYIYNSILYVYITLGSQDTTVELQQLKTYSCGVVICRRPLTHPPAWRVTTAPTRAAPDRTRTAELAATTLPQIIATSATHLLL